MGYAAIGALVIAGGTYAAGSPWNKNTVGKSIGISSPLSPKPPPVMPDQASVLQDAQLQQSKDASLQFGRAATVLTGTGASNTTGDKLGP